MTDAPLPDDRPPPSEAATAPEATAPAPAPAPAPASDDGARDEVARDELEEPHERRYPSTIGGAFYLCILITVAISFTIVVSGDWRLGVRWLAASLLAASALRLVLPQRDAGMLAVRHRLVDCVLLAGVGLVLLFLVATIPEQPL